MYLRETISQLDEIADKFSRAGQDSLFLERHENHVVFFCFLSFLVILVG
jgi:hypothetical protein